MNKFFKYIDVVNKGKGHKYCSKTSLLNVFLYVVITSFSTDCSQHLADHFGCKVLFDDYFRGAKRFLFLFFHCFSFEVREWRPDICNRCSIYQTALPIDSNTLLYIRILDAPNWNVYFLEEKKEFRHEIKSANQGEY